MRRYSHDSYSTLRTGSARVGDTNGDNQAALPPFLVCIVRGPLRRRGNSQQLTQVPTAVECNRPAAQNCRHAQKAEPPKPIRWNMYKIAANVVRLGTVEAPDAATAIEKAAVEYKVPATRLMAIRR
jgi:hypothetical protein